MKIPEAFDRGDASPEVRTALFQTLAVVLGAMREAGMLGGAVRLTDAPPAPFGRGSEGPIVAAWQKVIGLEGQPSKFGPRTEALTMAWAERAGFGPQKIVSPAMWALAFGVTVLLPNDGGVVLPDGTRVELEEAGAAAKAVLG